MSSPDEQYRRKHLRLARWGTMIHLYMYGRKSPVMLKLCGTVRMAERWFKTIKEGIEDL